MHTLMGAGSYSVMEGARSFRILSQSLRTPDQECLCPVLRRFLLAALTQTVNPRHL